MQNSKKKDNIYNPRGEGGPGKGPKDSANHLDEGYLINHATRLKKHRFLKLKKKQVKIPVQIAETQNACSCGCARQPPAAEIKQ